MAVKRYLKPLAIASFVASFGLLGVPYGSPMAWASSHEKPMPKPQMMPKKPQMMQGKPAAAQAAPAAQFNMPQPTTLENYLTYLDMRLQQEAMKLKQQGTAELKLTIAQDGTVKQTQIVRVEGPATLRDQITTMINQMGKLPPLPADANATELVVDAIVAFDYPGPALMDRFGTLRGTR
jgi:outer membrane biosynthesis protein TonB